MHPLAQKDHGILIRRYIPRLVSDAVAAYVTGLSPETIRDLTERGELEWVFNVGSGRQSALRWWIRELEDGPVPDDLDEAVEAIVGYPYETHLSAHTISHILGATRFHAYKLIDAGELTREAKGVRRDSLIRFLRRRIV